MCIQMHTGQSKSVKSNVGVMNGHHPGWGAGMPVLKGANVPTLG